MEVKERLAKFTREIEKIQLFAVEAEKRLNDLMPIVNYISIPLLDKLVLREAVISAQILKDNLKEIHSKLTD